MHHSATTKLKSDLLIKSDLIKQNMTLRSKRKFAGATLTQNFFSNLPEEEIYQPFTQSFTMAVTRPNKIEEFPKATNEPEQRRSLRRSRRKLEQTVLQPMKQEEKVEIFTNKSMVLRGQAATSNADDIEEFFLTPSQVQRQKEAQQEKETQAMSQMVARKGRRRSISRPLDNKEEALQKSPSNHKEEQPFEGLHFTIDLPKITGELLFDEAEEETKRLEEEIKRTDEVIEEKTFDIPKRNFTHEFNDEDEEEQPSPQKSRGPNNRQTIDMGCEYFDLQDEFSLRKKLFQQIPDNVVLSTRLTRDKEGFNNIWPEFHLEFTGDKQRVISAKKTSARAGSTFTVSRNKFIFDQTSHQYVGKVKSTTNGDIYNIFGPGLNPVDAKEKGVEPRQLLATLVYASSLFHTGGPRKFALYVLQPDYSYYKDFPQVLKYREEIPLSVLYSNPNNKDKIRLLHNRKPNLSENGGYVLNFGGLAVCPSIKNFILEDQSNGQEVVLFAKQSDNNFHLNISGGISPYVAFALAICAFDNRMVFND